MKAFVSGQSGVAVVQDGENYYIVRSPKDELVPCRMSTAYRLLEGSNDVEALEDVGSEAIAFALEVARAKDNALQYVLVLLEERESTEVERAILDRLRKLLLFHEVREFILNRLYAAPLTSAILNNARSLVIKNSRHPLADLLTETLRDQAAINRLRSAWDYVYLGASDSEDEKNDFFFSMVERGIVRNLVIDPECALDERSKKHQELIRKWREAAEIADSRLVQGPVKAPVPEDRSIAELPTKISPRLIANDPNLSYIDKRKLIKVEVQERCQLLKDTLDTKLQIEQSRLRKSEAAALAAISAYGDRLVYQLRDDFTKTLNNWGLRVNIDQLSLLTDFGAQLTDFKRQLRRRNLDPKVRKVILGSVDAAFTKITERLGNLAQDILSAASDDTEAAAGLYGTAGRREAEQGRSVLDAFLIDLERFTRPPNCPWISHPDDLPREIVVREEIDLVSIEDVVI